MSNSNLLMQGLTVSSVSLLNFHSTFRGYPLAPHSKVKSSPNFFATVFLSLLSNHGVTEIMMMMINIVVIKNNNNDNNNADENVNDKADGNKIITATDNNDITTNYNNQ